MLPAKITQLQEIDILLILSLVIEGGSVGKEVEVYIPELLGYDVPNHTDNCGLFPIGSPQKTEKTKITRAYSTNIPHGRIRDLLMLRFSDVVVTNFLPVQHEVIWE